MARTPGRPLSVPPASIAAAWKASTCARLSALSAIWRRPRTGSPWDSVKKDGLPPSSLPKPGGRSRELHQELQPERGKRFLVEGLASLVVGNGETRCGRP